MTTHCRVYPGAKDYDDYYWTPKFSTFIEYHYLNYTSSQINTDQSRDLGQHLVGAGLRFHFF